MYSQYRSSQDINIIYSKFSFVYVVIADAASEPEASEQVSSSNSYWALKVRF